MSAKILHGPWGEKGSRPHSRDDPKYSSAVASQHARERFSEQEEYQRALLEEALRRFLFRKRPPLPPMIGPPVLPPTWPPEQP